MCEENNQFFMVIEKSCDSEKQILVRNKLLEAFPAKDCQIFLLCTNIGVSCRILKYGVGERGLCQM